MRAEVAAAANKTARRALRRKFGYGMPDLPRALASALDDLALVSQAYIQPLPAPSWTSQSGPARRRRHFRRGALLRFAFRPTQVLEELENCPVRLKVTLSYIVEPYPLEGPCSIRPAIAPSAFGSTSGVNARRRRSSIGAEMPRWETGRPVAKTIRTGIPDQIRSLRDRSTVTLGRAPPWSWPRGINSQSTPSWGGGGIGQAKGAISTRLAMRSSSRWRPGEPGIDLQAQVAATARAMIAARTRIETDIEVTLRRCRGSRRRSSRCCSCSRLRWRSRRLVLEGRTRTEAAPQAGMDRQTFYATGCIATTRPGLQA